MIYGRMCQFSGKNGQCFMSYQTLAHELCLSRYSVVQNVKKLIEKKLIERESRSGQTTSFYFLWHQVFDGYAEDLDKKVVQAEDKLDKDIAQPPGQPSCPGPTQFAQNQKLTQENPADATESQPGPSQAPSPGGKTSGAGKDKQAGPQLSPLEEEYTELVLDCMQAEGKIQKNRFAVKTGIQKKITGVLPRNVSSWGSGPLLQKSAATQDQRRKRGWPEP
ncbi:MAG: helix-turn-helix domain-containing protein [Thermodesulfobacteriota bacterium]